MVANRSPQQSVNRVLLVEGQDDKHFVWQLCCLSNGSFCTKRSEHDFFVTLDGKVFQIKEKDNRSELIHSIRPELKESGREVVGVLVDTDADLVKCWEEVREGYSNTEITLPSSPDPAGTVIPAEGHMPKTGIWLMPDNKHSGELEDFVWEMISPDDDVLSLAHCYIDSIPPPRKFRSEKARKAILYAWLAARKEPGRMGAAVSAGDLTIKVPLCLKFIDWLAKLFG